MAVTVPDVATLRGWSRLNFAAYGVVDDATLQRLIVRAVAYIEQVTGRIPLATAVPDGLAAIAEEAIQRRVEQLALTSSQGAIDATIDDGVQSFSVPGYSETKFDRSRAAADAKPGVYNTWRELWELLWLLMTPAKRDEWTADKSGEVTPAFAVSEVAWQDETRFRDQF